MRFDTGWQHIKRIHGLVVAVYIILNHFHRLQFIETGLFSYFVFTCIGIIFEMSHIGYIPHIAYFISQVTKVAKKDIEGDGRPGMSQVWIAVYSGTTHIHSHIGSMERNKFLFFT